MSVDSCNFTGLSHRLPLQKEFHGHAKVVFLEARRKALAERDLPSIALMEVLLHNAAGSSDPKDAWTKQLEEEFGVDMKECRKALKDNPIDVDWDKIIATAIGIQYISSWDISCIELPNVYSLFFCR